MGVSRDMGVMRSSARRAVGLVFALALLGGAVALILAALEDGVSYYRTPAQLVAEPPLEGQRIRLGGYVRPRSVARDGGRVVFVLTDFVHDVEVWFGGLPPALFREGQGVIAEGRFRGDGIFEAEILLAKHDENYRPPDLP